MTFPPLFSAAVSPPRSKGEFRCFYCFGVIKFILMNAGSCVLGKLLSIISLRIKEIVMSFRGLVNAVNVKQIAGEVLSAGYGPRVNNTRFFGFLSGLLLVLLLGSGALANVVMKVNGKTLVNDFSEALSMSDIVLSLSESGGKSDGVSYDLTITADSGSLNGESILVVSSLTAVQPIAYQYASSFGMDTVHIYTNKEMTVTSSDTDATGWATKTVAAGTEIYQLCIFNMVLTPDGRPLRRAGETCEATVEIVSSETEGTTALNAQGGQDCKSSGFQPALNRGDTVEIGSCETPEALFFAMDYAALESARISLAKAKSTPELISEAESIDKSIVLANTAEPATQMASARRVIPEMQFNRVDLQKLSQAGVYVRKNNEDPDCSSAALRQGFHDAFPVDITEQAKPLAALAKQNITQPILGQDSVAEAIRAGYISDESSLDYLDDSEGISSNRAEVSNQIRSFINTSYSAVNTASFGGKQFPTIAEFNAAVDSAIIANEEVVTDNAIVSNTVMPASAPDIQSYSSAGEDGATPGVFGGYTADGEEIIDPWTSQTCPDINGDGIVNVADFGILAGNWLKSGDDLKGDFNTDGIVDSSDLQNMMEYWLTNPGCNVYFYSSKLPYQTSFEPLQGYETTYMSDEPNAVDSLAYLNGRNGWCVES
ncbi:MAG: hypothetical protein JXM68_04015, partial [Sedimentisphaerales bacterium]|nr:hypothetical protein [Sedimentisphaerales bacterium]